MRTREGRCLEELLFRTSCGVFILKDSDGLLMVNEKREYRDIGAYFDVSILIARNTAQR